MVKVIIILWSIVMVVENIIDILFTNRIIRADGVELNKAMRYAMNKLVDKWYYTKLALAIIAVICACAICFGSLE